MRKMHSEYLAVKHVGLMKMPPREDASGKRCLGKTPPDEKSAAGLGQRQPNSASGSPSLEYCRSRIELVYSKSVIECVPCDSTSSRFAAECDNQFRSLCNGT